MLPKAPLQDSPYDEFEAFREDALRAYRDAALTDAYMFGDYDGYEAYKEGQQDPLFFINILIKGIKKLR